MALAREAYLRVEHCEGGMYSYHSSVICKGKGKGMSVLVLTLHMVFARTSAGYPQPPPWRHPWW